MWQGAAKAHGAVVKRLYLRQPLRAFDDIRSVLTGSEVKAQQHIGVVRITAAQRTGHDGADEVLAFVELSQALGSCAQTLADNRLRNDGLGDHVLTAAQNAIDCGSLLIGTEVARDRAIAQLWHLFHQVGHQTLRRQRGHVVARGVTGEEVKADKEKTRCDLEVNIYQLGKTRGGLHDLLQLVITRQDVVARNDGISCRVESENHRSGHLLTDESAGNATFDHAGDLRTATTRRPQRGLVSRQRNLHLVIHDVATNAHRTNPAQRYVCIFQVVRALFSHCPKRPFLAACSFGSQLL